MGAQLWRWHHVGLCFAVGLVLVGCEASFPDSKGPVPEHAPRAVLARADRRVDVVSSPDHEFGHKEETDSKRSLGLQTKRSVGGFLPIKEPLGDPNRVIRMRMKMKFSTLSSQVDEREVVVGRNQRVRDRERRLGLLSDDEIDAENPEIRRTSRSIVQGILGRRQQATALVHWVYDSIEYKRTERARASETLSDGFGDCSEMTKLFVALARAARIPTRRVSGLAYTISEDGRPGFGFHAWPEVAIEGYWVPVDPTWNQPVADATHVALYRGKYWWLTRRPVQVEVAHAEFLRSPYGLLH